ncbi:hypothetical protein MHEL_52300 [Mycolicibacterium helvum]|uniref:HTH cro/C1-type domain-containing protein n=1 Tax=Mycolicibacterium helvum TaxID=1534349 RepID=A0A7I7TCR0_9MYCO|nr:hypothetical protein MHEL_52300 [Mycolicibacterium helvum]
MGGAAFGELLRDWRRRRRLSQLDLALEADVSARHVSFIESGRSAPSRAMVLRLADALAVPPREQNHLLLAAGLAPRIRNLGEHRGVSARRHRHRRGDTAVVNRTLEHVSVTSFR